MDKILTAISFVVLILGFCGCVEDRLIDKPFYGEPTDYLRFSVLHSPMTKSDLNHSQEFGYLTVEEEELSMGKKRDAIQTRSMPNIELDGLDASVSAFLNTDVVGWECTNKHFIFDYETLEPHSDGDKINWGAVGSAESMKIYAFSPHPSNTSALTLNVTDKTVTYVADVEDPTKHIDVITATAQVEKSMFGRVIPLTFNHAFTGLRFKMGFECQVKSLTITNVKNTYTVNLSSPIPTVSNPVTFSFTPNKKMKIGEFFNYGESTLMLPPQSFNDETTVTLVYTENGTDQTIQTTLNGKSWSPGKLITYTINKTLSTTGMIYFDLAAGGVELTASTYKGYRFNNGISEVVSGTHSPANTYYVYQSATTNRSATGVTERPTYPRVTYGGKSWADFITNGGVPIVDSLFVEKVIHAWDNKTGATGTTEPVTGAVGAVRTAGREGTFNWIKVTGGSTFNLIVDNIYSKYMENSTGRVGGGISFVPGSGVSNSTLTLYLEGDNRVGCVHYNGEKNTNNKLVFENYLNGDNGDSPGTLTVADVNYYTGSYSGDYGLPQHSTEGYYGNHWNSAIGSHDSGTGNAHGIAINSGIIFAGTTKAENCSAIGAGGNGSGEVTINGGTVVAIATTTGTAIGGGIGFHSQGGNGTVTIAGGNVYAYNFANRWNIPSSAIGGAGSMEKTGAEGNVTITNGNVYAYSALGTAIGGGSSYSSFGGQATIMITGGVITAKSDAGAGIGGGTGCSSGTTGQYGNTQYYGGNAHIRISGAPIIKTGSVGGGETKAEGSYLGKADIEVSGGDIQAQFIMEATGKGVSNMPKFVMNGGIIHNNNTLSDEFYYIKKYGGAVYMNEGSFTMNDGTIRDCSAEQGGAVYICGDNNPTFSMNGGTIKACKALGNTGSTPTVPNGGGLYLQNGT
ncbi:MAG: hypothetical protein IKU29_09240, partial [Parabacteroides sp.]|nr:hypothetical protein [Parabacteroides sp.]